jgi:hypothetical protein
MGIEIGKHSEEGFSSTATATALIALLDGSEEGLNAPAGRGFGTRNIDRGEDSIY